MHFAAYAAVAQMLQLVPPPTRVVEIGARDLLAEARVPAYLGSVRPLFNGASYIGVDRVPGPGVDVVADGATYRPPAPPDCVVCCEVLEHAENWRDIVTNMAQMLASGGTLLVTCAGPGRTPHSGEHAWGANGGPAEPAPTEYYRNIPPHDLDLQLQALGLEVRELLGREDRGDVYVCAVKR